MNSQAATDSRARDMSSASWVGEHGEKWNTWADQFEGMIAPAGQAALEFAAFTPGEHVIDVGCGAGITTLQISPLVVPGGHVTGLDINPSLIETSHRRAREAGLANVDFITADAATARLERQYDHLFSRFGVMFFEDPVAAFHNMRTFLRDGGRFSFACWGPPPQNPWVLELMAAVGEFVELPEPPPGAPGPFAFADRDRLAGILDAAGFSNVDIRPWSGDQLIGGPGADAAAAARFIMAATMVGDVVQHEPEALQRDVEAAIAARLSHHRRGSDIVMQGTTWLVRGLKG